MAHTSHSTSASRLALAAAATLSLSLALSGCAGFFVCEGKASCPASTTSSTTSCTATTSTTGTGTDFAYVTNSSCGTTYLNGYVLSSAALTPATGFPYSLGYTPQAMVINPGNDYLFIASDPNVATGYIFGYTIGTGGAISPLNSGSALVQEQASSLAISPDGNWLFALNSDGSTVEEYQITSGTLTFITSDTYTTLTGANVVTPSAITVAPSADFIVMSLGTAGLITVPFNTTTGALDLLAANVYTPSSASVGIYAASVDILNNVYAASTSGLLSFTGNTSGALTLNGTNAAGTGPHTIVLNAASTDVYLGNLTDSTITGFPKGTGTQTAITGSPFGAPTDIDALGRDSSGSYLLAAGYNSSTGIELFSINSSGVLTAAATTGSGTNTAYPVAVALTH